MPAYTEGQLLAIGQHMRQLQDFPKELEETDSDEGIVKGFTEFGGIIRHVSNTSTSECTYFLLPLEQIRFHIHQIINFHMRFTNLPNNQVWRICLSMFVWW
jgi:hypothetical protein